MFRNLHNLCIEPDNPANPGTPTVQHAVLPVNVLPTISLQTLTGLKRVGYNTPMKKHHIARLESRLETLVEGAFGAIFSKKIQAKDIALLLARAMAEGGRHGPGNIITAPDEFTIRLSEEAHTHLKQSAPDIARRLASYLTELAYESGYRLNHAPEVTLIAERDAQVNSFSVSASHRPAGVDSTAALKRVTINQNLRPGNPHLIINNRTVVPLDKDIVNIGRGHDNHIVVDDPYVSRHHIQLRLRFGAFALFDVRDNPDTIVNGVRVIEHNLRAGDMIQLGNTELIYMQDDDVDHDLTQPMEPPV